jgi:hypothetical protein
MTPAQPALDAMMEGVRELRDFLNGDGQMRGKSFGDRNAVGHAFWWRGQLYRLDQVMDAVLTLAAEVRTLQACNRGLVRLNEATEARAIKAETEVRAQRETIAGLDARVEALTGALHAAPNPSKFGAGIAEYQRLAEALQDWRQDHVCPALSKGDTP